MARSLLVLSILAAGGGCLGPELECGFGERDTGGQCEVVDHMYVNLDERQDINDLAGTRSGIGVNACAFNTVVYEVYREAEGCAALRYPGESSAQGFSANAGVIVAELDPDPVLMLPDGEDNCYATDLHPLRRDLFSRGDRVHIEGSGGTDFPEFMADLPAPHTLVMVPPDEWVAGDVFSASWIEAPSDQMVVVAHSHDEDADESVDIHCTVPDNGSLDIPADLTAELLGETANLYFLRQNRAHIEPAAEDVAIELLVTSSVTRSVPILR